MRTAPAAPTKGKASGAISLGGLFDDLKGDVDPKVKDHIKKDLPQAKKPGFWDPEVPGGAYSRRGITYGTWR